jgi:hypothetical protein
MTRMKDAAGRGSWASGLGGPSDSESTAEEVQAAT